MVRADVIRWLANAPPVDLALVDPPYATGDDTWAALLASIRATRVVLESNREVPVESRWEVVRQKRYGTTVVIVAHDTAAQ